jgi:CCR4-NOT complex subunit CAF16
MSISAASASAAGAGAASASADAASSKPVVEVKNLNFTYGAAANHRIVLHDMSFELPRGSRTLLVGDNGAGKSTLLRLLAGKHIHAPGVVRVLGRESYFDTTLNLLRAYLATDWGRKTVAFSGVSSMSVDIAVRDMMADTQAQFLPRRAQLVELLGVDLDWRMHQLSDGQRRRVQIMLQLLRPAEVLLLDEITTDLDLITRQDFLNHLKTEAEAGGSTVVYATHVSGQCGPGVFSVSSSSALTPPILSFPCALFRADL